jgi:hypothetical protein
MKFTIKSVKAEQEYYSSRKGEPYRDCNKAYIWASGESVLDNLMNRYSRPHKFYQKEVLPSILAEVKEKYPDFQLSVDAKDWGWRQKCGCRMCGCSPGFIQKTNSGTITISAEVEFISE